MRRDSDVGTGDCWSNTPRVRKKFREWLDQEEENDSRNEAGQEDPVVEIRQLDKVQAYKPTWSLQINSENDMENEKNVEALCVRSGKSVSGDL